MPGILVTEANGGLGMSSLDAVIVAEALGSHTAPAPFIGSAVMAPVALQAAGVNPDDLLAKLVAGEKRVGIAVGEAVARAPGCRDHQMGLPSAARPSTCSTMARILYLVADANRALFLVDASADGLSSKPLQTIDRTRRTGELVFDGVEAQQISDDPAVLQKTLDAGRVMLSADTLGAAQNMLTQAVEYSQGAGTVQPAHRFVPGCQTHVCRDGGQSGALPRTGLVCRARAGRTAGRSDPHCLSRESAYLARVGKFVAKTATEVHGGMGFTDLLGLHYWFKRIGFNRQLLGAPELIRREAARIQDLVA